MDKLRTIIGPAPSEIPFEDLIKRLAPERERVRQALARFRASPPPRKKSSKKPKANAELSKLLKETGMSPGDLMRLIEEEE